MSRRQARADEFVTYVDARRSYLRRVAYLVCGDWHAAEDLVQTALIKLYAAWPRIHTDGAEDAYVRRIIVRAHLDERRRPWRRERVGLDGVDAAEPETLSFEDNDALLAALKTLPQRQRATIVLRYWVGLSVEEAADDLGCTTGTVKSQTSRAMASLRASLSTDDVTTTERRSR
ncbi:SigE family RNA polymerase sigma factor [Jiangella ureilytica]|uniref:SigE family RNA polymerase sigma factor n=1 Tax=Jiangella ureilytica TaxID=2530374 RepID=A0A4V2XX99_9ACTN|nr:SigE family RNA polymerase sigma factor [Jiangella ureilytica]TDC52245.1 SigE family RNA polymerase sigma factor [Jiangella ureilytica]